MSEEEALLAAIRADPHDDSVRLVYCDWLDDQDATKDCDACDGTGAYPFCSPGTCCKCASVNGSTGRVSTGVRERAAFIRRGIKNPKRFTFSPGHAADVAFNVDSPLDLGSGMILRTVLLCLDYQIPGVSWITRRGFIDGVQCTWGAWLINCDTILERHPICFVSLDSPVRLNGIPISGESWIPGRKKRCFTGEEIAAFKTTRNKAFPHRGAAVLEMTFPHIEFEQSENFRMDSPPPTEGSWGSDPARAMR